MAPWRRGAPEAGAAGSRPRTCLRARGRANRGRAPRAATRGTAARRSVVTRSPDVWGAQRWRPPPALIALVGQSPRAPVATGAGGRAPAAGWGCRWPRAAPRSAGPLAGAQAAEGGDRGARIVGHRGDRERVWVDLHADAACARRGQGGPPG